MKDLCSGKSLLFHVTYVVFKGEDLGHKNRIERGKLLLLISNV